AIARRLPPAACRPPLAPVARPPPAPAACPRRAVSLDRSSLICVFYVHIYYGQPAEFTYATYGSDNKSSTCETFRAHGIHTSRAPRSKCPPQPVVADGVELGRGIACTSIEVPPTARRRRRCRARPGPAQDFRRPRPPWCALTSVTPRAKPSSIVGSCLPRVAAPQRTEGAVARGPCPWCVYP